MTDTGWPYKYRARVIRYDGWLRHGWVYVIDREWVHWNRHTQSFKVYDTEELAEDAANAWLDRHDRTLVERGKYV